MGLVTWEIWLPCSYKVKSLKKTPSFPEPMDLLPWNLVCSVGVSGPSCFFFQMMTGLTLTQFISRSNLVAYAFVWEKVEIVIFLFFIFISIFFVPRLFEEKRRDTVFGFPWCVVRGAWCVARGAWCVARGAWRVVRGSDFLVGTLSP